MKMKVGHKLYAIREERKLNQQEMADLLKMTPSSYSRLERGETSIELEQLVGFSKELGMPVQDLLPEILSIHNHSKGHASSLVFGNYYSYNYANADDRVKELEESVKILRETNEILVKQLKELKK